MNVSVREAVTEVVCIQLNEVSAHLIETETQLETDARSAQKLSTVDKPDTAGNVTRDFTNFVST